MGIGEQFEFEKSGRTSIEREPRFSEVIEELRGFREVSRNLSKRKYIEELWASYWSMFEVKYKNVNKNDSECPCSG